MKLVLLLFACRRCCLLTQPKKSANLSSWRPKSKSSSARHRLPELGICLWTCALWTVSLMLSCAALVKVPDAYEAHQMINSGELRACESTKSRTVRQIRSQINNLQRFNALVTGLHGGWLRRKPSSNGCARWGSSLFRPWPAARTLSPAGCCCSCCCCFHKRCRGSCCCCYCSCCCFSSCSCYLLVVVAVLVVSFSFLLSLLSFLSSFLLVFVGLVAVVFVLVVVLVVLVVIPAASSVVVVLSLCC